MIGSGAVVGAQAIVRSSVVMTGAFVGEGAVLTDSIVGANARVEAGAVIDGYSVLGDGTRAEPGERLHAVRRPEEPSARPPRPNPARHTRFRARIAAPGDPSAPSVRHRGVTPGPERRARPADAGTSAYCGWANTT